MLDPKVIFLNNRQINGHHDGYSLNTNYRSWNEEEDPFRARQLITMEDEDSDASTPPFWSNSNSPLRTSPQHKPQTQYRTMSPNSRSQAIARGQRELMEMVNRMPEGCYELSLKDIVEHPVVLGAKHESLTTVKPIKGGVKTMENKKRIGKKVVMDRSGSFENGGFLLKMVLPFSFGSKKAKRSSSRSGSTAYVDGRLSPRPLLGEGSLSNKGIESGDWWKKGLEESIEESSESVEFSSKSGSSKSSGSSSSRSSRIGRFSCWSWIFNKKDKRAEEKRKSI